MRALHLVIILIAFSTINGAFAQTKYWVGSGITPLNWNTSANWSTVSGGIGGAGAPVSTDDVIFDGASGFNAPCLLNVAVNVKSLTLTSLYTGFIDQTTNTLIVTGKISQSLATFIGGTQSITAGSFTQTGGTFTATSGTMLIKGNADFSGGTFNTNGGVINFQVTSSGASTITSAVGKTLNDVVFSSADYSNQHIISNHLTVNNATFDLSNSNYYIHFLVGASGSLTVNGKLTFSAGSGTPILQGGKIYAKGDIDLINAVPNLIDPAIPGTIEINGTGTQTLKSYVPAGAGRLANIVINKPSGDLNLDGTITTSGPNWTWISGNVVPGTSTVWFYQPSGSSPITVTGNQTFANVTIQLDYYANGLTILDNFSTDNLLLNSTLAAKIALNTGTITVNKLLSLTGAGTGSIVLTGGTIYVKGDISLSAAYTALDPTNTSVIYINGSGNQKITGTSVIGQCVLPNITINKPSGILTLSNYITYQREWTYIAGTVDPGSSTVFLNSTYLAGDDRTITNSGSMSFYNLRLQNNYNFVNLVGALDVNGDLTVDGTAALNDQTKLNTSAAGNYAINIAGNYINNGQLVGNNSTVTFDGILNQDFTSIQPVTINILNVNKTSGYVNVLAPLSIKASGQLLLTKGLINTPASTAPNYLKLNNAATTSLGNASSYINGPMLCEVTNNGSRTLNLPVGAAGAWRPAELSITHNSAALVTYKAELKNGSAYSLSYSLPPTLQYVSGKRYWKIDAGVPANNFTSGSVKLYFDTDDEVSNLTKLGVAKGNPSTSSWADITGASKTGTGGTYLVGSITSSVYLPPAANSFSSLFALANLNLAGTNNPLPIELSSFSAEKKNNQVLLQWKTESELNNEYFSIERAAEDNLFIELGSLKGAGTSREMNSYQWLDEHALEGRSYYRLKQVDSDDVFTYSKLVTIQRPESNENRFVAYPLPVTGTKVFFNTTSTVRIINSAGVIISKHENIDQIDISALSPGLYYLINQKGQTQRMMIAK